MDAQRQPPDQLVKQLEHIGQQHLLDGWSELDAKQQAILREQIESIDFDLLSKLIRGSDKQLDASALAARAAPPPAVRCDQSSDFYRQAKQTGEQALAAGEVGFILVAGGQGSRLGFPQPKGMLPVGPVSHRTLFEILLDVVRARSNRSGCSIPVYVMTSDATDHATREYFEQHKLLGIARDDLHFFCQGSMPAVDAQTHQVLKLSRDSLALSPDGHGGMLAALAKSGGLDDMRRRQLKYLFYGQVDNPLLQVCDPFTIGAHILHQSEMTTQVVRKTDPLHRVGNVVTVDGQVQIIEYSDLPESFAAARNDDGSLYLWAGSIAVHVFSLDFLERQRDSIDALPFHRAHKKVDYIDSRGVVVRPERPNALKFERFIFDLLPHAQQAIVVEIDPADGFAPVKNDASAATETLATAQSAMIARHRRWLELAGCVLADSVAVEIHPDFAVDQEQLLQALRPPSHFSTAVYLK